MAFFLVMYSASDKISEGGGPYNEGEDIEVLHVPFEETLPMINEGEIRDAKTIILLQHLMIERLQNVHQ